MNDLEKAARNALMAAFADDTRLSKAIRGEATEEDMFLLSMDLHRVISWALANNMELNESKFDLLCYSYRSIDLLLSCLDPSLSLRASMSTRLPVVP